MPVSSFFCHRAQQHGALLCGDVLISPTKFAPIPPNALMHSYGAAMRHAWGIVNVAARLLFAEDAGKMHIGTHVAAHPHI